MGTNPTRATRANKNMASQPKAGTTQMSVIAAIEPPIGTPDIINVAMVER